jgi:Zn-dependent protease
VVLHELGHALTARRFGIRTLDITLLPIGGVARLQRMPEEPIQELLVAFAGPAVNVVLAALLAIVIVIIGGTLDPGALQVVGGPFLVKLLWINVSIALFNLLPAFPMDGGRVLRAILAFRLDYARATELAARIGQGMAVLFGIAGLFLNPMLLLIALFVWVSAGQEAAMVRLRTALSGIAVREAMITNFKAVAPTDSLGRVAALMLAGFQHDFPVIEGQQLAGVLTRNDLIKGLAEGGPSVPVGRLMRTSFATAEPTEMLEDALGPLQEHPEGPVWVLEGDLLLGMLTLQNIGELIAMHDAVREPRRS